MLKLLVSDFHGSKHTVKTIPDGNLGWYNSTGPEFPLSTPVITDSLHQRYIPVYVQADSCSIQDYPDPNAAMSMDSFNMLNDMQNMHISHPQAANRSGVDDLAMMFSDCRQLSQYPNNFSVFSEDYPANIF